MENTQDKIHKFEAAGLGKAPFRCLGVQRRTFQACQGAPIQPGASCQYCWTAISNCYLIQSSDGKQFVVGCECIRKAGDKGLVSAVKEHEAQARREKTRIAREKKNQWIIDNRQRLHDLINASPIEGMHPHTGLAEQGRTLKDYYHFIVDRAGYEAVKEIEEKIMEAK